MFPLSQNLSTSVFSLVTSKFSLISGKDFLFSWAKIVKLSKESKNYSEKTALWFDGLTCFPVKGKTTVCPKDLTYKFQILLPQSDSLHRPHWNL